MKKLCRLGSGFLCEDTGELYVLKPITSSETVIIEKLKQINHPNLARMYGIRQIEDVLYSVQEYVPGITLTEYTERNGILDDKTVLRFTEQLCNGVNALHKQGLIHRDIKPDNIIVTRNNQIVLTDYSITRLYREVSHTDTQILGTPGYAAPEQFGFTQTDARSDIYAIGVTVNYMKTKQLPNEQIAPMPFTYVVQTCIQMDANRRYANINALKNALHLEGRELKKGFASNFPGFRDGCLWQGRIYCMFLGLALFIAFYYLFFGVSADTENPIEHINVYGFLVALWLYVFPILIATDTFLWEERLGLKPQKPKKERYKLMTLFCVFPPAFFVFIVYALIKNNGVLSAYQKEE